ncbi:ABC1 kinase family protein [Rubrobacter indicoceani]|uniref:ABC1 kinase family protein n=1 Tax=Rubrobacter indicoceani TaxID=2051957 RepID=UPI0013C4B7C9|nr:AarF/UbiB family protein [Rubrobacter indicoceani]
MRTSVDERLSRVAEGLAGAQGVLSRARRRSRSEAEETRRSVVGGATSRPPASIQQLTEEFFGGLRSQSFLAAWAAFAAGERVARSSPVSLARLPVARLLTPRSLAIATVASDVYSAYASLERRKKWYPNLIGEAEFEEQHRRGAERVLEGAATLGGSLIKAGQFASSRPDLLPEPYVNALSELQDRVPPRPFAVIRRAVEYETGRPLRETFRRFDEEAVAAASIAQVHRAMLHDGREVAVKVRYPEVAGMVEEDLSSLEVTFDVLNLARKELRLHPISDYLRWTLPMEVDLLREMRAMTDLRSTLSDRADIVVPEPVEELCTEGLLVMEYIEGVRLDPAALDAAGIDRPAVAELLNDAFADQLFRRGIFHADPHPGNLRVLAGPDGPRLLLYDHGLTLRLEADFVAILAKMVVALRDGDFEALGGALGEAGLPVDESTDLGILLQLVGVMMGPGEKEDGNAATVDLGGDLEAIGRVGSGIGDLPPRLMLVGRAIAFLDSITRRLDEETDALDIVAEYTKDLLTKPESGE